jgi:sec-independent protein translocase protein TatA
MSSPAVTPLAMNLGPTEILLIILVVILLFGAKKLPELARGSGRALRIFKAETKGLGDDDADTDVKTASQRELDDRQSLEARQASERAAFEAKQTAEREAGQRGDSGA